MKKTSKKKSPQSYFLGMGVTSIGTGVMKDLPVAMLDFCEMKTGGNIGDIVAENNLQGPKTRLVFLNLAGFDTLIERVTELKEKFLIRQKEYNASINKSSRRPNKLGKSPRKGKASGMHDASPSKRRRRSGKSE